MAIIVVCDVCPGGKEKRHCVVGAFRILLRTVSLKLLQPVLKVHATARQLHVAAFAVWMPPNDTYRLVFDISGLFEPLPANKGPPSVERRLTASVELDGKTGLS